MRVKMTAGMPTPAPIRRQSISTHKKTRANVGCNRMSMSRTRPTVMVRIIHGE